jgi:hypothetical protein
VVDKQEAGTVNQSSSNCDLVDHYLRIGQAEPFPQKKVADAWRREV